MIKLSSNLLKQKIRELLSNKLLNSSKTSTIIHLTSLAAELED
jgi:hypothetical protein